MMVAFAGKNGGERERVLATWREGKKIKIEFFLSLDVS